MRKCNRSIKRLTIICATASAVSLPGLSLADVPITQFTPGDYLIMRGGDPTNPNGSDDPDYNGEVNAYIDEYTQSGYYVGTLDLPGVTLPGANASSHEGNLNISPNGQWIAFAGYPSSQSPAGSTPHDTDGTENAVLGEVNLVTGPSSLNTSTILSGSETDSLTGQYVHSAMTIDGNEFYVGAKYIETAGGKLQTSDTGLVYVDGTGTSSTDTVLEGGVDWRNILVYNGQLYGGTGSSSVGTHGVYQIGNGTPTTNDPIPAHTELTDYPGGQSASSFAFADVSTTDTSAGVDNGYNVLYTVGDQSVPGITKYYYNTSTQTWDDAGLQVALNGNNIYNPYDIVATVDPTNPSWVDITVSGQNGIYTYIDKSGNPQTALPSDAFTQLVTPPSYASFYGMTQDPGPANLVWGNSGNGQSWDIGTSTNWTYASSNVAFATGDNVTFDDTSNNPGTIALNTTVQPGSITVEATKNAYTIFGTGSIGGSGVLRLLPGNTSTFTLDTANTYTGGTIVSGGTLLANVANAIPLGSSLTINNNGMVVLAAGTGLTTLSLLSITANGTLNITDNHLIVADPGGSIDATIEGYLASGYNGGNWNGMGINTTAATGTTYGIGWADGATGGISAISSGQIEIKYTLYGDTNLDGVVNGVDFGNLAANFGKSGPNIGWAQGSFTYNNTVNGVDFGLLAGNFGKSLGSAGDVVTATDWAALDAFAQANGLITDVPEPACFALIAISSAALARRRRKT